VLPQLDRLLASLVSPSNEHADQARRYHATLTKPSGSLGRLESLGAQLSGIYRAMPPPPAKPAVALFAGDHGIVAEGVTPWPSEVTAQMVRNIATGGAAINAIALSTRATLYVIDVGVAGPPIDHPNVLNRRVRSGTANFHRQPAMTVDEAEQAIAVGATIANELIESGANVLVGGEMGIGNTTPAAALIAALCDEDPINVTGRGTGVDDAMYAHKVRVIAESIDRCGGPDDPIQLLAELGGLEIAALAGFYIGAAALRVPIVVDGVICIAAALVANEIDPIVSRYMVSGHRSTEPGASIGLSALRLRPLLDLEMRLGEGSGATLALPLIDAAGAVLRDMATFDSAAVTERD
jgi:nicotinate-nucleotide--dimethylbenzimidazole phosphoribosyltransferase